MADEGGLRTILLLAVFEDLLIDLLLEAVPSWTPGVSANAYPVTLTLQHSTTGHRYLDCQQP